MRTQAGRRTADATTTAEIYDTIRWVLSKLGDRHSLLLTPEQASQLKASGAAGRSFGMLALVPERVVIDVEPGGGAERAGVRVGDIVLAVVGRPPQGKEVLDLPTPDTGGGPARVRLDLRRNTGGSLPPMLQAVGPILGDGKAVGYRDRNGPTQCRHRERHPGGHGPGGGGDREAATATPGHGRRLRCSPAGSPAAPERAWSWPFAAGRTAAASPSPPLAFPLATPATRCRPGGTPPHRGHRGRRTGATYQTRIRPDQLVATDWTRYGPPQDPVLQAATRWLE